MGNLPILYSFRRCPYAMRARWALAYAGITVELREITLKNKPMQMLAISPKGTVPVLQLPKGKILDESLEIMYWALAQNDPDQWLPMNPNSHELIIWNDGRFKYFLDCYKYADRYPQYPENYYREQGETFLQTLESILVQQPYLNGSRCSLIDIAIAPFIRQFGAVDRSWFQNSPYPKVRAWLENLLATELFSFIMVKHPIWQETSHALPA